MKSICIFGDSIVWGQGDSEKGGWVSRLQNYFKTNNYEIGIHNFSVSGDTARELLQRFEKECTDIKPDTIVFAIGINDSKYIGRDNAESIISPEEFQSNLIELVNQAKKITERIIFVGLTDVDESKTASLFWEGEDTNTFFSNSKIDIYNSKVREIAGENDLLFIDMPNLLNNSDLGDGLHPNAKGHEKMFGRVRDFLLENGN